MTSARLSKRVKGIDHGVSQRLYVFVSVFAISISCPCSPVTNRLESCSNRDVFSVSLRLLNPFIPCLFNIIFSMFLVRSRFSKLAIRLAWPTESPSAARASLWSRTLELWILASQVTYFENLDCVLAPL